ncbi:MAG: transposase [Nitrosomonas sp.]|nr:transposase [Nitrosomonas sp.]MBP6077090.1 transposase [Nitrosomonas sp.]
MCGFRSIVIKYFWGGKLWTQSYFVETIDNANEELFVSMYKINSK